MIIEKGSEIKVLENFYDGPFDYMSIAEISRRTGISRNWIYGIVYKFEHSGILSRSGKKYKLDFSSLFCKRLKLLFDSEHLASSREKGRIFAVANKIIFELNPDSVVLVGSAAVHKSGAKSDLDFLVVGEADREKVPYFENSNVILLSKKGFEEKYVRGDDFVISSLVFGKVVHDAGFFMKFFESPLPIFSEELVQEKIRYCEILEGRIYALIKTDDAQAMEELLHLALQAARIILLKNRVIPETKHDIASQVGFFNKELERMLRKLLGRKTLGKEGVLEYLRKCMSLVRQGA